MKKVSLYIPCYNAEKYIGECLDGVIKQIYPIDEILVIDDGSNDKTAKIASSYPVKIIRHNKNRGLAASRNTAFQNAQNEFVAALDSDCVPHPDWLEQLMKSFQNDDIVGVGGKLIERNTSSFADKWRSVHMIQHWGDYLINDPPFLYGNNTVFEKEIVKSVGFYNEFFRNNHEDIDISQRISSNNLGQLYNPNALVEHIRVDTLKSVLTTYCNWHQYQHINHNLENWRNDFHNKNYDLLFIDIIFLFYYQLAAYYYRLKHLLRK